MDFVTGRGVTQGNHTSPMIFNIMVGAAVRAVLGVVCGPQEANHRIGWVEGEQNLVLYVDERRIAIRYQIWVKDYLPVTVAIFRGVGLDTNLENRKSLVCTPG